jgi:hypothetical protein
MAYAAYTPAEIAAEEARLASYLEAEAAALRNQSYQMPDGRQLTRANLKDIRDGIESSRGRLDEMRGVSRVKGRARRGVIIG